MNLGEGKGFLVNMFRCSPGQLSMTAEVNKLCAFESDNLHSIHKDTNNHPIVRKYFYEIYTYNFFYGPMHWYSLKW